MITTTQARLVLTAIVLGIGLFAACGTDPTETVETPGGPADRPAVGTEAPSDTQPAVGTEAPSDTQPAVGTLPAGHVLDPLEGATRLDGSIFELAAHREDLPTVLWFWAPWCPNCREMAPDLVGLSAEYEGRLTVLGVAGQGEVDRMEEFVADAGAEAMAHVVDGDGTIWQGFGITAVPTFLFVTPDGEVAEMIGPQTRETMAERFDQLLAS